MSLRLGDIAPDFIARTSAGVIRFHEYLGDSWGVLFSHPADYTPVCTTELGKTAALKAAFEKRNVKVLALSVDNLERLAGWIKDINETMNDFANWLNEINADKYDGRSLNLNIEKVKKINRKSTRHCTNSYYSRS